MLAELHMHDGIRADLGDSARCALLYQRIVCAGCRTAAVKSMRYLRLLTCRTKLALKSPPAASAGDLI